MTEQLDLFVAPGPPPIPPIPFSEARLLSGADAQRILCGEPREKVLAERKAWLREKGYDLDAPPAPAPEPSPPEPRKVAPADPFSMAKATYINLCDSPLRFRVNDAPGGEMVVHPERSVWLLNQSFNRLDFADKECLVGSQDVLVLVRRGEIELTDRLCESLRRAGLQPPERKQ
jgi:hypothetical protein